MRLVEVVMLMGAHCVSPVEHSQMMTDAAKVQCAVVIARDTEKGTLTVMPRAAAQDPLVAAAVARFAAAPVDELNSDAARIVPARAPAGSSTTEIKLPPAIAPDAAATPTETNAPAPAATAAPAPEKKVAVIAPPPQKPASAVRIASTRKKQAPARPQPAAARKGQCKGAAVASWHETADGRKRFRCVNPTGGSGPAQLY